MSHSLPSIDFSPTLADGSKVYFYPLTNEDDVQWIIDTIATDTVLFPGVAPQHAETHETRAEETLASMSRRKSIEKTAIASRIQARNLRGFVAKTGTSRAPIGFVTYTIAPRSQIDKPGSTACMLNSFFVSESARRQYIGLFLGEEVLGAVHMGDTGDTLDVEGVSSKAEGAAELFEKMGFLKTREVIEENGSVISTWSGTRNRVSS